MTTVTSETSAPTIDEGSLSGILRDAAERLGVAGAQVAVWDGETLIAGCTGIANAETGEPMTSETLLQIGSTTKLFAAALTLQLMDEGRVDLDEPVISYLPDFRLSDPAATKTVTLRQLHSMTSGIDNGPYTGYGPGDDAVERYVPALADIPQIAVPGAMTVPAAPPTSSMESWPRAGCG